MLKETVENMDIIEARITDLSDDGNGIGRVRLDGSDREIVAFIKGSLPGDFVKAKITKRKKNYLIADLLEIIETSKDRIKSDCVFSNSCGGCSFREFRYEKELEEKQKQVKDKLIRIAGIQNPRVNAMIPSPNVNEYRNKVTFHLNKGRLCFYKIQTHELVHVDNCKLIPEIFNILKKTIERFIIKNAKPINFIEKVTMRQGLSSGEIMVVLNTHKKISSEDSKIIEELGLTLNGAVEEYAREKNSIHCFESFVIIYSPGKSKKRGADINSGKQITTVISGRKNIKTCLDLYADENKGADPYDLKPPLTQSEEVVGTSHIKSEEEHDSKPTEKLTLNISPTSFYQINEAQARNLYMEAISLAELQPDDIVFDLYCGTGSIGLALSGFVKFVVGIESEPSAIIDANRNAVLNNIVNAIFLEGRAEEKIGEAVDSDSDIGEMIEQLSCGAKRKIAFLDPPRKGCAEKLLKSIVDSGIDRIVYISCNPATLARDVGFLIEHGYEFLEATPVDMFPKTKHVETVCLMSRVKE